MCSYSSGCRCDDCKAKHRERMRTYVDKRRATQPDYYSGKIEKQITCPECGKTAIVNRRNSYCGSSCATTADNRKRGYTPCQPCKWCGEPTRSDRSYCSPGCIRRGKARQRLSMAAQGAAGALIWTQGSCFACALPFCVKASGPAIFCTDACANRVKQSRRRATIRAAFIEDVSPVKVFSSDGYRCHLCKRLTLRNKVVPHPRAPTVDHLIPLARGGTHEPSNCRTACFLCNSTKRDGSQGEQLLLAL